MKSENNTYGLQLALLDRGINLFLKKDPLTAKSTPNPGEENLAIKISGNKEVKEEWKLGGQNPTDLAEQTALLNTTLLERAGLSLADLVKMRKEIVTEMQAQVTERTVTESKFSYKRLDDSSVKLTSLDLNMLDFGIKLAQFEKNKHGILKNEPEARVFDSDDMFFVVPAVARAWEFYKAYKSGAEMSREAIVLQKLINGNLKSNESLEELIALRNEIARQLK
ncbi:hypothetical protein [Mucilaginibacter sp.]|jgi:hypothetical protein|uniref:hypothetical protein n=1 Tax=Mucilaginibacter sp. TaxID=1882438 RepID=UPI0035689308